MTTIQPSLDLTPYLLENGNVQSYAWPGGYPIYFILQVGEAICPACVSRNRKLINEAFADHDQQWNVVSSCANYEDDSLYCCRCNEKIESAYGEPEDKYEVIVGNVGTVHTSDNERDALLCFNTYVDRSKSNHGRCAVEDVTMMHNGDIVKEYVGTMPRA